jgi:hypothetical protein
MSFLTIGEGQFTEEMKATEEFLTLVVKGEETMQNAAIPTTVHQLLEEFGDLTDKLRMLHIQAP